MGADHKSVVKVEHLLKPGYGVGQITRQITEQYVIVEWGPPTNGSSMEALKNLRIVEWSNRGRDQ